MEPVTRRKGEKKFEIDSFLHITNISQILFTNT